MSIIVFIICASDIEPRRIHTNGRTIGSSPIIVLNIAGSYADDFCQMARRECRAIFSIVSCRDLRFHANEGGGGYSDEGIGTHHDVDSVIVDDLIIEI